MILDGLNPEQRAAAEATRGPVCILAGAGSGKTTTITRRIAHQVASRTFEPGQILAVTFTDKAATEMRARLTALGVEGVAARTFHSAALAQLRYFAPARVGKILPAKALELRHIANRLRAPYKFRPAADLATEIEWARNRRIPPERYLEAAEGREPPIPAELMHRVYAEYEARKRAAGLIDFEDLLELTIELFDSDPHATEVFRSRYRAFTVDEYQDVNFLQQSLLERWVGDRDELCVVGDDYQSIYSFTGASPEWLLRFPERYPAAMVVRLEANYRSSPELLALANLLVPRLEGAEKTLRATQPPGPAARAEVFVDTAAEVAAIVDRIRGLHADGLPLEEMALLVRTNARAAEFELALSAAEIPFQGASLLARESARFFVRRLRTSSSRDIAGEVRHLALAQGWLEQPPEKLGEREETRQADLTLLVRLAADFDDGERTGTDFVAQLEERFDPRSVGSGLHLLTYHRAKGLEFEAVFLPRLGDGELPSKKAVKAGAVVEERRLFYVGVTRAKRELWLSWTAKAKPSRFLFELELAKEVGVQPFAKPRDEDLPPAFTALKAWRLQRARADGVPPYVVFHDRTLVEIAERQPRTEAELAAVSGVGPAKLERYGSEVLAALAS